MIKYLFCSFLLALSLPSFAQSASTESWLDCQSREGVSVNVSGDTFTNVMKITTRGKVLASETVECMANGQVATCSGDTVVLKMDLSTETVEIPNHELPYYMSYTKGSLNLNGEAIQVTCRQLKEI